MSNVAPVFTALLAAGNMACEIYAGNQEQPLVAPVGAGDFLKPRNKCFEEEVIIPTAPPKAPHKKVVKNSRSGYRRYCEYNNAKKEAAEKETVFETFILNFADTLVERMSNSEFTIVKSEYEGIDEQQLVDFLFKQDGVESVDVTNDGIVVLMR